MNYKLSIKLISHILFWFFYISVVFILPPSNGNVDMSWFEKIDFKLLATVVPLAYINDQLLLPYFFKKRHYLTYGFIIVLICMISYSLCFGYNIWEYVLPILFLSLIWLLLTLFENQKELEIVDKERLEMELKFLKSQINPHVLFNNINTVYAQAVKGSDNVADMILMLSENLKYILFQSEAKTVTLEKDVDFIDNYLAFQRLRTEGINNIEFHKNIDSYNYEIAPLLLIGLIENAFKHSKYKEDTLSDIIINLSVRNGILTFKCSNEIENEHNIRETEGFQIGLKNLKKRLELIYPEKYSFNIHKKEYTFIANLEITL